MQLKFKQKIDQFIGGVLVGTHIIPVRILGKLLRINHKIEKSPDHIIFIKMLGFGSLLLASDAILAIKKKYPTSKITLIGGKGIKEGAELMQIFDQVLIIDDSSFIKMIKSTINIVLWSIKKKNKWCFDLEVYSRLTTILSLYTFSHNRFGFEFEKVNFRNYLNTHNVYFNQFIPTESNYNLMALRANAKVVNRYKLPFEFSQEAKFVFFNNTCSDLSLQRKLTKFQVAEIIEKIQNASSYQMILIGAPNDYEDNQQVIELLSDKSKVENWAGKMSFNQLIETMATKGICLITIDSAPLHIASRIQLPVLSIWGPTQPDSIAPNWLRESNIYKEINLKVSCSPCVHHTKELPCKGNNFCIKDIKAEQVVSDFFNLIGHV